MLEYSVEFRIWSEESDFDLNAITKNLGLTPTNTRQRGEMRSLSSVHTESMWGYNVSPGKNWRSLEKGLDSHLKVLMPLKEKIAEYTKKHDVMWWCAQFTDFCFSNDLRISPKFLKKLSDFGVQLRFDSYLSSDSDEQRPADKELMKFYKQQEQHCIKCRDNTCLLSIFGKQADVFLAQGRFDKALATFKKQEQILKEIGDMSRLSKCLGNQADIFLSQRKRHEELVMLKRQESILKDLRDKKALSKCLHKQAAIFFYNPDEDESDKAMLAFKQQEMLYEELGDVNERARSLLSQAIISIEMDNLDDALALAKKAYGLATKHGLSDLNKEAKAFLDTQGKKKGVAVRPSAKLM